MIIIVNTINGLSFKYVQNGFPTRHFLYTKQGAKWTIRNDLNYVISKSYRNLNLPDWRVDGFKELLIFKDRVFWKVFIF